MEFNFVPMNLDYAKEMIDNWKYGEEYQVYDYVNETELLLDEENWGHGKFAVLDEKDELVGEFTIEFFKEGEEDSEDEGYVEHRVVRSNPKSTYEMWVGWGLKPELCGKGLGEKFVASCIDFAIEEYNYKGEYVHFGVASFNKRAIKVYERLGFETFRTCEGEISNEKFEIYQMRRKKDNN
ncbi:GNAT family N-acetyltransferase [Clostridium sp. D2Q-11]|uniref:GNAT family N-acetyltransferase n=1 Tax=Anaeromonas frigoriresistens TaxID=2683708 RepID=A0A942Z534_9FIRM|nr:GNAT family N-acetyltransferase [Anaeromonas frigoriresistens]MBS4536991.1 GNAT family N-acetyltransferase [Anaeromonas frigoriresistens]